ncbi:MAG TPA: hypothetical protein PLK85_07230 [Alphaproteobacteria bacterium]|nr:hypothetical protein [Alphaproteobacteria bacterium]
MKLSATLAVVAVAGFGLVTDPEEAQAQQTTSLLDRLPVNVTHCVDIDTVKADELVALRVHYKTDKCRINGDHIQAIERAIAEAQRQNPGQALHAFVVGETDPRASDDYNIRLGQRRANGLAAALRERGVEVRSVLSIGESRAPQTVRNNPEARNSYAVLGNQSEIAACLQTTVCPVTKTVESALRFDR